MAEVLRLEGVERRFGGVHAIANVSFAVQSGEVLGLIGPNGAGKTTLVNVVTGIAPAQSGRVLFMGKDITRIRPHRAARLGISRTFQIVQPFPDLTVEDNVAAAALFSRRGVTLHEARAEAEDHLTFVGLAKQASQPATSLPLAMRKRLELAKALALRPHLLFLDEVNAGLTGSEIERAIALIHEIARRGVTIVMIEHLMKVVLNVCTRIVVLHNGAVISDGPPASVVEDPAVVKAYLGPKFAERSRHGRH
jgi:branched-chain amino acid transport system ATP-binding protein